MKRQNNSFYRVTINLSEKSHLYLQSTSASRKKGFIVKEALYLHISRDLIKNKLGDAFQRLREIEIIISLLTIVFSKNDKDIQDLANIHAEINVIITNTIRIIEKFNKIF